MATLPCFSAIFQREHFYDFLFASLDSIALPKWGLLLKKGICSLKSKFFSLRVDPTENSGKNENGKVAFLERVSFHLEAFVTM